MSRAAIATNSSWRWPDIGVLLAVAATAILDAVGLDG